MSIILWDSLSLLKHGREASVILRKANWIGDKTGGPQKMGANVTYLIWLVSHLMWQSKAYGSRVLPSVMEQEQGTYQIAAERKRLLVFITP